MSDSSSAAGRRRMTRKRPRAVAAARPSAHVRWNWIGAGSQVRLVPVSDYEDRAEAFNTFVAMLSASQLFPATELPETSDLIRFELESFGARPPKPIAPGGTR